MNDTTTPSSSPKNDVRATSPLGRPANTVEDEKNVSSGGEGEEESSFVSTESNDDARNEHGGGQEITGEGKQKRKRTRQVEHMDICGRYACFF